MRSPLLLMLGCAALILSAVPASANLMYRFDIDLSGTGHGTVTEILGFPNSPDPELMSGCVKWTLTGGDDFGGACGIGDSAGVGFVFENDQIDTTGNASHSVLVGDVSTTMTPWSLAIAYDPSQNSPMTVEHMVLTFYNNNAGGQIYSAYLPTPHYIANPGTGSGGSGFLFSLDWDQAAQLQGIVESIPNFSFSDVRLGLGAEISEHDTNSWFYVMQVDGVVQVPEPFSMILVLSGLGAVALLRRRRTQA